MLNLDKGSDLVLSKDGTDTAIKALRVGLGWDPAQEGANLDFDVSVVICQDDEGQPPQKRSVVYYGALTAPGIKHFGDDLTGNNADGDDPDEEIEILLDEVQGNRLEVILTLHQAGNRGQTLGSASKCFMRLGGDYKGPDGDGAQFDVTQLSGFAAHFATIYKANGEWHVTLRGDTLGEIDLNQAVDKVLPLGRPEATAAAA